VSTCISLLSGVFVKDISIHIVVSLLLNLHTLEYWLLTDVEMAMALRLLPLLMSEAPLPVAVLSGKKRKRNTWRPTALETLQHFVDVQKVVLTLFMETF